ncbi:MAG: hypothetical protein OES20_13945 [Gammaproteobacteria bacterium]|nr:hypothetical protein [Gammaproteobacteria bacterium]MDH3858807.1 hypothetical protein [Gammaproteobacteria bacterium]
MLIFKPYRYGETVQRFQGIGKSGQRRKRLEETKWRAVKIRPGLIACDRVANLTGNIYLSQEAPNLPLDNCTEENCRCHYIFFDDRRNGRDRRIDLGKLDELLPDLGQNRRNIPGRRVTDLAA